MKIIKQGCYKGTRIIFGNEKPDYLQECRQYLKYAGFIEIQIPIIQLAENFKDKVGEENNNMMYNFNDRGNRDLCLAPEYTAIIQKLANTTFKDKQDVRLFYVAECFRGEKPQAGRYRQFTQLGVEVLNPSKDCNSYLQNIALELLPNNIDIKLNTDVTRGLDYYKDGKGFDITCDALGSSKQICGGGEYDGGVGFAIGVDRCLSL
jgi:histidyl-tRNA synthetase